LHKFRCYKNYGVPIELYGKPQCNALYPKVSYKNAMDYIDCLIQNEVSYDRKEACLWLFSGKETVKDILQCWDGCADGTCEPGFVEQYDFDYCYYQEKYRVQDG